MSWASAEPVLRLLRWVLLVAQLAACAPSAAGEGGMGVGMNSTLEIRRTYLDHWHRLARDGVSGLERFASTVQLVVDTRAQMAWSNRDAAVRAVLDDLVDLFVGSRYQLEKTMVMSSESVLGDEALTEGEDDLSGFAPLFQGGEGRFRHFALNAAAAYALPETLVALAALLRGGDLQSVSAEQEADRTADIATNRIGREFSRLLRKVPLSDLGDGRVSAWIVERFGGR